MERKFYNWMNFKIDEAAPHCGVSCNHKHATVEEAATCAKKDDKWIKKLTFGLVIDSGNLLCELDGEKRKLVYGKERENYYKLRGLIDPDVAAAAHKKIRDSWKGAK